MPSLPPEFSSVNRRGSVRLHSGCVPSSHMFLLCGHVVTMHWYLSTWKPDNIKWKCVSNTDLTVIFRGKKGEESQVSFCSKYFFGVWDFGLGWEDLFPKCQLLYMFKKIVQLMPPCIWESVQCSRNSVSKIGWKTILFLIPPSHHVVVSFAPASSGPQNAVYLYKDNTYSTPT